jgi:hypothetical protein
MTQHQKKERSPWRVHQLLRYVGICGQGPSDHPDLAKWLMEQGIDSVSLNPDSAARRWWATGCSGFVKKNILATLVTEGGSRSLWRVGIVHSYCHSLLYVYVCGLKLQITILWRVSIIQGWGTCPFAVEFVRIRVSPWIILTALLN